MGSYLKISLHPRLENSPGQESAGGNNKDEYYRLVFSRVSLCAPKERSALSDQTRHQESTVNSARGTIELPYGNMW